MCQTKGKEIFLAPIISNYEIAPGIYEMVFEQTVIASLTKPGQFINMYCSSQTKILPRPISICEVNTKNSSVKVVYAVVGKGTEEFSKLRAGDTIKVLGPLGNGYTMSDCEEHIIVGGGVGTPPLLELVKRLAGKKTVYLGFRTNPYLVEELEKYAKVYIATDDGSVGHKGTVIDLLDTTSPKGEIVYACGPKPMLEAVKHWAHKEGKKAQLSLEERMGCGIGACVGCVCKIKADNEYGYTYKKVCVDGPVFWAEEVIF